MQSAAKTAENGTDPNSTVFLIWPVPEGPKERSRWWIPRQREEPPGFHSDKLRPVGAPECACGRKASSALSQQDRLKIPAPKRGPTKLHAALSRPAGNREVAPPNAHRNWHKLNYPPKKISRMNDEIRSTKDRGFMQPAAKTRHMARIRINGIPHSACPGGTQRT